MKIVQAVCPITMKKARVTAEDDCAVTHEEPPEGVQLPLGWARITIDVAVPNPATDYVKRLRVRERAKAIADLKAVVAEPTIPETMRASAAAQLQDPTDVERAISENFPMPTHEVVLRRITFPVVSDEGITSTLAALQQLGFPVPGGAQ
jgi:hypothetical protein